MPAKLKVQENIYSLQYINKVKSCLRQLCEEVVTDGASIELDGSNVRGSAHLTIARAIYCHIMRVLLYPSLSLNIIRDELKCKKSTMVVYYSNYARDKMSYNDSMFTSLYLQVISRCHEETIFAPFESFKDNPDSKQGVEDVGAAKVKRS
jgi:hypothetical protein